MSKNKGKSEFLPSCVDRESRKRVYDKHGKPAGTAYLVTCPRCQGKRWVRRGTIMRDLRQEAMYLGLCMSCVHSGDRSGWWRGGERKARYFHPYIKLPPNHRFYCMTNVGGCVRVSRLTMAKHLNRPLYLDEDVHHKNKDTTDNRIENLELRSHSGHARHHKVAQNEAERELHNG